MADGKQRSGGHLRIAGIFGQQIENLLEFQVVALFNRGMGIVVELVVGAAIHEHKSEAFPCAGGANGGMLHDGGFQDHLLTEQDSTHSGQADGIHMAA